MNDNDRILLEPLRPPQPEGSENNLVAYWFRLADAALKDNGKRKKRNTGKRSGHHSTPKEQGRDLLAA
jgi:hypothetical protein